jgi:hypothetical protein
MGYEVLKETPLSVEKMSNLDGIIWAVAPEYENASLFLGGLENLNNFDSCTGVWLDRLGQLVCLDPPAGWSNDWKPRTCG